MRSRALVLLCVSACTCAASVALRVRSEPPAPIDAVDGMRARERQHFVARFEGDARERVAWTALDILERAYFHLGDKLGLHPTESITVVIYTGAQYQKAVAAPDWSQGVYDGKIHIREGSLSLDRKAIEGILRHEYTHAALAMLHTPLPAWFNEGLAERFEGTAPATARAVCAEARKRAALPAWESLQQRSFVGIADGKAAGVAYAASCSLVEALVALRGEYALQLLIKDLAAGAAFESAFQAVFARSSQAHYKAWVDSL